MPGRSNRKRFPNNVVLEEDPYAGNFPLCVRISGAGPYKPERKHEERGEKPERNSDIGDWSSGDGTPSPGRKPSNQGETNMSETENYEYGADDYSDMLEHLARFVEIARDYGIEIRRATDDDDNSGYVPLTRDYIENDGVPRLTVIEQHEDKFWEEAFSNKSVANE